jgi:hypothetical protein
MQNRFVEKILMSLSIISVLLSCLLLAQNYSHLISSTPLLIAIMVILFINIITSIILSFVFWSQIEKNILINVLIFFSTACASPFFIINGLNGELSQIIFGFIKGVFFIGLTTISFSKLIYAIVLNIRYRKKIS